MEFEIGMQTVESETVHSTVQELSLRWQKARLASLIELENFIRSYSQTCSQTYIQTQSQTQSQIHSQSQTQLQSQTQTQTQIQNQTQTQNQLQNLLQTNSTTPLNSNSFETDKIKTDNPIIDKKNNQIENYENKLIEKFSIIQHQTCADEHANINSYQIFENALKKVFLNSRNLGQSYQKKYQFSWELSDLKNELGNLNVDCLKGQIIKQNNAIVLQRNGCEFCQTNKDKLYVTKNICQFWREAIDGLIMGLCENERYVRNHSLSVNDSFCQDIFFSEDIAEQKNKPVSYWKNPYRWGSIPSTMAASLKDIENKFSDLKVNLTFLGMAENQLFYKLESGQVNTCGVSGTLFKNLLEKNVKNCFPNIELKDATPVAVISEGN